MIDLDDDIDGVAEDYLNEQAYFNNAGATPFAKDGLEPRYTKLYDSPDCTTCDCCIVDRTTNTIIQRYDAADPANTKFDYGAMSDDQTMERIGRDIKEMVDPALIVSTPESLGKLVTSSCRGCSSCHGMDDYQSPAEIEWERQDALREDAEQDARDRAWKADKFNRANNYRKNTDHSYAPTFERRVRNFSEDLNWQAVFPVSYHDRFSPAGLRRRNRNQTERKLRVAWRKLIRLNNLNNQ